MYVNKSHSLTFNNSINILKVTKSILATKLLVSNKSLDLYNNNNNNYRTLSYSKQINKKNLTPQAQG